MMRSSVDLPGVKPLCYGRCVANIVLFIRARYYVGVKTLAETDRSDIRLYLGNCRGRMFPFHCGRLMARFQSVGMTHYFHTIVKRGTIQLIMGAPPDFRSSAVMLQIPGACKGVFPSVELIRACEW